MKIKQRTLTVFIFFTFFLCSSSTLFSQQEGTKRTTTLEIYGAYLFGNQEGFGIDGGYAPISYKEVPKEELSHNANDPGRGLGTTWGGIEGKVFLTHSIKVPFLVGEGVFSNNNIEYRFSGELTPMSIIGGARIILTPIAFLKFSTGASVGTGWTIGSLNGLGRNLPGPDNEEPQTEPLSGVVYGFWFSGTFQFDLGAVVPGEWSHVVMAVTPKIEYKAFTGADADTPWEFEGDGGKNFNGWKFKSSWFLGYQMPIFINTVGILMETNQYIANNKKRSTKASNGWGSDFTAITFGPLANVKLSDKSSLTILVQFENAIDYSDATIGNRYFEYREYQDTYIYFTRIAFIYGIEL